MSEIAAGPLSGGRLSYVFVDVHDLPAALAFYRDVLALPVDFEQPGVCAFLRLGGGPQLALYAGRADPPAADGLPRNPILIVLDVPDVEAAAAALTSRGVTVGPVHVVPGGRAALFEDPEGNRLEVHQTDTSPHRSPGRRA